MLTGEIQTGGYNANLTKASLKVGESRLVAGALLHNPTDEEWSRMVVEGNLLQKRNPSTARTLASVLRQRLETLGEPLWRLVAHGDAEEAKFGVLAATTKQSRLLADYLRAIGDLHRGFAERIPPGSWNEFIRDCAARDAAVSRWTAPVVDKLRQNTARILAEAGYVESTKSLRLLPVQVPRAVQSVLTEAGEDELLSRLRVAER